MVPKREGCEEEGGRIVPSKKSMVSGWVGQFCSGPRTQARAKLFIDQVLAIGIAWAFALETGGMPVMVLRSAQFCPVDLAG